MNYIEQARQNINALCKAKGVKISDIEKEAGVSKGYIRSAKNNIRVSVLDVASKKLDFTIDELLHENLVPNAKLIELNQAYDDTTVKVACYKKLLEEIDKQRKEIESGR